MAFHKISDFLIFSVVWSSLGHGICDLLATGFVRYNSLSKEWMIGEAQSCFMLRCWSSFLRSFPHLSSPRSLLFTAHCTLSVSLARPSHHCTISGDTPHIFSADDTYRSGRKWDIMHPSSHLYGWEREVYEDHMLAAIRFILWIAKWNSVSCARFGRIRQRVIHSRAHLERIRGRARSQREYQGL